MDSKPDQQSQSSKSQKEILEQKQEKVLQDQEMEQSEDDVVEEQQIDQDLYKKQSSRLDIPSEMFEEEEMNQSLDDVEEEEESLIADSDEQQEQKEKQKLEKQREEFLKEGKRPKKKDKIGLYDYQNILFNRSLDSNRIIYLPTGKGKTMVSIASMYYYLCKNGENKKIVFLANTIQLVKQQADAIKVNLQKIMNDEQLSASLRKNNNRGKVKWTGEEIRQKVCCIHGEKTDDVAGLTRKKKIQADLSSKRQMLELFKKSTIIVMIAQMFLNCLRRGYIKITDFSFMVLDQCHHCHGDHPYAGIMRQFYFNPPKPDKKELHRLQLREQKLELPIIMGLSASPVMQESCDKTKLVRQIEELCSNLKSKFTHYEIEKLKSDTVIEVVKVTEPENRQVVALLISHFEKFRDHKQSYLRIQSHFPKYFECVEEIIDFLKSKYEKYLDLQCDPYNIPDIELLLFYDIKECLLIKLRDVWLELGQFAFSLAFKDLYADLGNIIFKTQENKQILNQVKQIVKKYIDEYENMFGKCTPQFFSAKVNKLLQILLSNSNEANDMVVVFASKRRTVKYLQKIIQIYSQTLPKDPPKDPTEDKKPSKLSSGRVTGYSVRAASDYSKNETIFESDPSSTRYQAEAEHRYNSYLSDLSEDTAKKNLPREGEESESKNLANELRRIKSVKYGKLLLEVEEKYSTQISTIEKFRRKEFRILITTSVTEQGFDIPHCKIVISFDKPSSLKSYIQIKGRARQQFSKYYIFTSETEYEKMCSNKSYYDDIINATEQIAINKFSDKEGAASKSDRPSIMQADYKRIIIGSSGAIINTNYSLQILKMYCSSLRHPNKAKFYFIQTPNLAFRCLIHFPKSAPTSKPWIVGQSKSSKNLALKSAAFEAVKYLYTQKYIKEDLRPKKQAELEDEREIEKFEDLEETRKNQVYKKIFEEEVRIKCQNVLGKKFMRFYFRTIKSSELDFPYLNPAFMKHQQKFQTERFSFQIYMMNFTNSRNMKEFKKDDEMQEVGVLMCFEPQYLMQAFSGYEYSFEQNNEQKFSLKLQQDNFLLNKAEYERLKRAHQFIVASSEGSEPLHYSKLTSKKPFVSRWVSQLQKFNFKEADTQREYYPILVILKKKNGKYTVDQNCLNNIEKHQKIFSAVYDFHNYSGKQVLSHKFPINLSNQFSQLTSYLKMNNSSGSLLVQSLQRQLCFSKCIIAEKQLYDAETEKSRQKKSSLATKNKKLVASFEHAQQEIVQVVRVIFWNKYKKEKKKQIFERDGKLSFKEVENSKQYLMHEFIIHPLSSALLFKCSLATEFLFKAVFQYNLAFTFRNSKLSEIFNQKLKLNQNKLEKPFTYKTSPNVILENGSALFKHLASNTNSLYLRNIGKSYSDGTNFLKPIYQFSMSKINVSLDESSIINEKSQYVSDSMNMSELGLSALNNSIFSRPEQFENMEQKNIFSPSEIKVTEILKVLTSRMYKFNKVDNYEEYEFIGDVVLKMLSTVQVFLDRPQGDESELHLARANLVCNANLHRKSILKNIYRYVLTKKRDELAPPYMYSKNSAVTDQFYEKTTFKIHNQNSQIEGYNYIPGKVHADIVEGLIGAFYLHSGNLEDCQILLYFLDILKKPSIKVNYRSDCETEVNLPKAYLDFEERIGYHFKNKGHLIQALTHSSFKSILTIVIDQSDIDEIVKNANKSFSNQQKMLSSDVKEANKTGFTKIMPWETYYERYEFLGDSILDLIVVEYLHEKFGTKDQGTLSALKQAGVSNKTLGMIAISQGMHELILMDYPQNDKVMKEFELILKNFNHFLNNPEALIEAKVNSIKILGDVFEALVGAIFVDLEFDYVATKAIVLKIMKEFLVHYTDLQTLKKTSTYRYQQFLSKNNYRDAQLRKDTSSEIDNGNFKFLLVDRSGAIIDQCWETTQKRAWDKIIEQFYNSSDKKNQPIISST